MDIEYEATFINIGKDKIRTKLKKAGAKLIRPEFLQKRTVFNLPRRRIFLSGDCFTNDNFNFNLKMPKF